MARRGWDFAVATPGTSSDYYIDALVEAGTPLSVTLDWFVNRAFDEGTSVATDVSFADLDLEVWRVLSGLPVQLVASSESAYSNVEHLYIPVAQTGEYMLRVKYFGDAYWRGDPTKWTPEGYAIAWMVPEPATPLLLIGGTLLVRGTRPGRRTRATF